MAVSGTMLALLSVSDLPLISLVKVSATSPATFFRPSALKPRSSAASLRRSPAFPAASMTRSPARPAASASASRVPPKVWFSSLVEGNSAATAAPAARPATATARGCSRSTRSMPPSQLRTCFALPTLRALGDCPPRIVREFGYGIGVAAGGIRNPLFDVGGVIRGRAGRTRDPFAHVGGRVSGAPGGIDGIVPGRSRRRRCAGPSGRMRSRRCA